MIDLGISRIAPVAAVPVETRSSSSSYTDLIVAGLLSRASGTTALPDHLGVLEACSGFWSRAFMLATVEPMTATTAALTASWRAGVARDLLRRGEHLSVIDVDSTGRVTLIPAMAWTVRGTSPVESSWSYEVDLISPDRTSTRTLPAASVLHVRYAVDPGTPWAGKSPLQFASDSGRLAAGLERALSDEVSGPTGQIIPIPRMDDTDSDDDPNAALRADIAKLRGRVALPETTAAGYAEGRIAAPSTDWKVSRLGGAPPAPNVALRDAVANTVMATCGVPAGVFGGGQASGQREAFRAFYRGTLLPVSKLIESEVTAKLDVDVTFDFKALAAADVATSARAFGVLVKGGLAVDEARKLSGLD